MAWKRQNTMKPPLDFTRIFQRKKYSVRSSTLIASDDYWDGHNWERQGRNRFLYRTPNGAFFLVTLTRWQNEQDSLKPVTQDEAITLFETTLTEHSISYALAFPGVEVIDA
jgi:hypothetical protein